MINHKKTLVIITVLMLFIFPAGMLAANQSNVRSTETFSVTDVPKHLELPDFYKKYVDANGIPIVSSEKVRDAALLSARITVLELMAKREDVRKALIAKKFRIMIIGENEEVCDLPEYAPICNTPENIKFWNWRARGFGSDPEGDCGASCGEENVLCLPGDRYEGESILVHEFAHTFHLVGIAGVDPGFNKKLQKMFLKAKAKGLWENTYAMTDSAEYFAEAVQSFFNTNRYSETPNGVHGPIDTRAKLKKYDPDMYKLLLEFFYEKDLTLCNNSPKTPVYYNSPGVFNPIIPGYFADPTVRKFDDTYYVYSTTDGTGGGNGPSQVWKSKDFVNWTIQPMNWPNTEKIWAPDVMKGKDGKYYMFYCQPCKIYCAVSDSPTGPWKNIFDGDETVLVPDRFVTGAITLDGQSFVDDDGSVYLYWGTWGIYKGFGCGAGKLSADMKSLTDTVLIPNTQIKDFFEGPFVFKRNGVYYLTYSSGSCHDQTYRVQYAISKTGPLGPYEYQDNNPILETSKDLTVHGPGHHSVIKEGNEYYIVYHRHNIPNSNRGFHRQICADRLVFGKDGKILKVEASHKGIGYLQKNVNPSLDQAYLKRVKASSYYNKDFRPMLITDNNNATMWRAGSCNNGEWVTVDFTQEVPVKRIWTQFEYATSFYQYIIETSSDEKNWKVFADKRNNTLAGSPMIDHGDAVARYVRLTFTGNEKNGLFPAIWNMKIFSDDNNPIPNNEIKFNSQPETATPEREGLIFDIDADFYESKTITGKITTVGKSERSFTAIANPVKIDIFDGKKAFIFDGKQKFISDFSLPATFIGNPTYTISALLYSENPENFEFLLDFNDSWGELEKVVFGFGKDKEHGITMHNGSFEDQGINSLPLKQWVHVAVSFDGYMEKIYINGKLVSEKNIFLKVRAGNNIFLGCKFDDENPFKNKINSLRLYDYGMNSDQIEKLYIETIQ